MFNTYLKALFILITIPIILIGYSYLFLLFNKHVISQIKNKNKDKNIEVDTDEEESPYFIMKKQREEALDERIARIKEEIADNTDPASELHPSVRNIPHDQVMVDKYPDVEQSY